MPYDLEQIRQSTPAYKNSSLRRIAESLFNENEADFKEHGINSVDDWADQYGLQKDWADDDKKFGQPGQVAGRPEAPDIERGTIASGVSSVTRGLYGAGEMGLRFLRSLPGGPEVGDDSALSRGIEGMQKFQEETPFLQASQTEGWGGTWREGVESAVTSLTTAAPGAIIGGILGSSLGPWGTAGGAWLGGQISRIMGAPLFGVAEYDSYVETGLQSDKFLRGEITREEVEAAGIRSGLYETGFEFGSNILEAMIATPGVGKLLGAPAKDALKKGIRELIAGGIKGTRNRIIKTMGAEVPSEMVTAALQAGEYNLLTDEEQSWFGAAKDAFGPSMVASLIFGGLADVQFRTGVSKHAEILADPMAEAKQRMTSVEAVGKELDVVAPQYAQQWRENAEAAVQNNQPIGDELLKSEELSAPEEGIQSAEEEYTPTTSKAGVLYHSGVKKQNDLIREAVRDDPFKIIAIQEQTGPGAVASMLFEDRATSGILKNASIRNAIQNPEVSVVDRMTAINDVKMELENESSDLAGLWGQTASKAVYEKLPIPLDESLSEFEIDDTAASETAVESTGNDQLDKILNTFIGGLQATQEARDIITPAAPEPTASAARIDDKKAAKEDLRFNSIMDRIGRGEEVSKEEDQYVSDRLQGKVEEAAEEGGVEVELAKQKADKEAAAEAKAAETKITERFGVYDAESNKLNTSTGNEFSIKKINRDNEGKPISVLVKSAANRERTITDEGFSQYVAGKQDEKKAAEKKATVSLPTKAGGRRGMAATYAKVGDTDYKGWYDESTGKFVVESGAEALASQEEVSLDNGKVVSPNDIVSKDDPWVDITGRELPESKVPNWEAQPTAKEAKKAAAQKAKDDQWRENNKDILSRKKEVGLDYEAMENKDMKSVSTMSSRELAKEYQNHPHIKQDPDELRTLYYKDEVAMVSLSGHEAFQKRIGENKTESEQAWSRAYEFAQEEYLSPEEDSKQDLDDRIEKYYQIKTCLEL